MAAITRRHSKKRDPVHFFTHIGGRRYGSGKRGSVYDLACTNNDSVCHFLEKSDDDLIVFTTNRERKKITAIDEFISTVSNKTDLVAKQISAKNKEYLTQELKAIYNLLEMYSPDTINNYTSYSYLEYNGLKIIAFKYGKNYYIINKKCEYSVKEKVDELTLSQINQLIKDILNILNIFSKGAYFHGDIKLDNIMYCTDTYKLIDFGYGQHYRVLKMALATRKNKPYGSRYGQHPILQYLYFGHIPGRIRSGFKKYAHHFFMQELPLSISMYKRLSEILGEQLIEPSRTVIKNKSQKGLFEKYKSSFDVAAFGLTLLIICIRRSLPDKYFDFVYSLINPQRPDFALNPADALENFRKIISNN